MIYDKEIQGNIGLFENPQIIKFKDTIILTPVFQDYLEAESILFLKNSNTEDVKKYLKNVYVENQKDAHKKLLDLMGRYLFKSSLFYCIRLTNQNIPIGYIHLNTPLALTGINSWTVDFWMGSEFQQKNIMTASLSQTLSYLQQNNVPEMNALVHIENTKSRKLLEKIGFRIDHQEQGGEKRFVYKIKLN